MKYEGNRLSCKTCKFHPKMNLVDNKLVYDSCPNIDHNKIRLYTQIFNGYEGSLSSCNICDKFNVATWNRSSQKSFKGMDSYIEFMDKDFYEHNNIKDTRAGSVTVCIGDYDCYGEIHYVISLFDWSTGNWFIDNNIKFLEKRLVLRSKSNKPLSTKLINNKGTDDLTEYLTTNSCKYLY